MGSLDLLDKAEKLGAKRIKEVVLDQIAKNFSNIGRDEERKRSELFRLDKELLIDIIIAKAKRDLQK